MGSIERFIKKEHLEDSAHLEVELRATELDPVRALLLMQAVTMAGASCCVSYLLSSPAEASGQEGLSSSVLGQGCLGQLMGEGGNGDKDMESS